MRSLLKKNGVLSEKFSKYIKETFKLPLSYSYNSMCHILKAKMSFEICFQTFEFSEKS